MSARPLCPECGVEMAYSALRDGNCLNPDCVRCWYGPSDMSLVGLRKRLVVTLGRTPERHIAMPREFLERLVALLPE